MLNKSETQAAQVILQRYLSLHEDGAYTYRPFMKKGLYRRSNYRYLADLSSLLPQAAIGEVSYIWGTYQAPDAMSLRFALIPFGPVRIYVNGTLQGRTTIFTERYRSKMIFDLELQGGKNDIVLECENTIGGFGCEFGTWVGKLDYYFFMPRCSVMEGLCYSQPQPLSLDSIDEQQLSSLEWLPNLPDFTSPLDLAEVFPNASDQAWAVVTTSITVPEDSWYTIACEERVLVDNTPVSGSVSLKAGRHELKVFCHISDKVQLSVSDAKTGRVLELEHPVLKESKTYRFAIAGPFEVNPQGFEVQYTKPFSTVCGLDFWHLEGSDTYLRMYNENPLFGHWNYPLGVTLYGLVESQRTFSGIDPDLAARIDGCLKRHLQQSIDTYDYAMWDKQTLGGATAVHHLMTSLDSLDDCGSFGSTLLEIAKDHTLCSYEKLVDVVGQYISKKQPRLSDGTFFRTGLMHEFHENTMWVDDLYMSVPFLVRYARYTGKNEHIDDAVAQFQGFAKYLYMPEKQLMSHVYDFDRNIATGIPWGRGNGWALFSLSELLMMLPESHSKRGWLVELFRNLSNGFLVHQDAEGMFHQVLDTPESYQESSCTSMFACAAARGVRFGWYEMPERYADACIKAVEALKAKAIDADGHVWGVCRGSEFSCSRRYYAEELLPRLDDTHGIGIILLALCERMKLG